MVRGAGKFKTKRGGGRSFSRDLTLDSNGIAVGTERWPSRNKIVEKDDEEKDDDDEEEEEEEEEESEEEEAEAEGDPVEAAKLEAARQSFATAEISQTKAPKPQLTREERRQQKKARAQKTGQPNENNDDDDESEDDTDLVNPNHVIKKVAIADLDKPRELTRKEREAKEKREAQERYWKLHREGKTDQAKSDLARLAQIRKEREAAQAKRTAEAQAKADEAEAKRAAQKSGRRT